jgi:hypothetical protein
MPRTTKVTVAGADWLAITFRRRKTVPLGVNYIVEESTNLTTWTAVDIPTHTVGWSIDQGDGTELVTVRGTHAVGTGQSFLRLRLSEQ